MKLDQQKIAVIGLGYVGLPLAVEFAKQYRVVGFDINVKRVGELKGGHDHTKEVDDTSLKAVVVDGHKDSSKGLFCSCDTADLAECTIYIVTVPTPVDKYNRPDLTPLYKSSETVARSLSKGNIVIYESTVYPGVTEEECVPVLEKFSGLKYNQDFFCGYSPERINPGDKVHTVTTIRKVTAGSTPEIADIVDDLYKSIIKAGTHKASGIKVAEAAKVIENAQRDINIAFVNELAKIFNRMGIDTHDVLEAAGTKWNFLPFKPGLVGGHCIGVDPYYLAQKAQEVGYHPEIILAGRRLNDGMGGYVAHEVVKLMIRKNITVKESEVLLLGVTFKENCSDVRNTRVVDIIRELKSYSINVTIYDPVANSEELRNDYDVETLKNLDDNGKYDAIVLAVAHDEFLNLDWPSLLNEGGVIYDVKGCLDRNMVDSRL